MVASSFFLGTEVLEGKGGRRGGALMFDLCWAVSEGRKETNEASSFFAVEEKWRGRNCKLFGRAALGDGFTFKATTN